MVALEFALIGLPFLTLLMFVFELSLDLSPRRCWTRRCRPRRGKSRPATRRTPRAAPNFIATTLCPDLGGLLSCAGLYVKVQKITPSASQDYWDYTTGTAPVSGGALDLSSYGSAGFCNSGPSQMLLVSAVYVGPSFLGALVPGGIAVTYGGQWVHPTLSTVGVVTEAYTAAAPFGAAAC